MPRWPKNAHQSQNPPRSPHLNCNNVHPTMVTNAVGVFTPYATSTASTSAPIPVPPMPTAPPHAFYQVHLCTTCGTTPILWPRLSLRQRGTDASLFSSPSESSLKLSCGAMVVWRILEAIHWRVAVLDMAAQGWKIRKASVPSAEG